MTAAWYEAVLSRLPQGYHLLDVGIGTGTALLASYRRATDQIRVTP